VDSGYVTIANLVQSQSDHEVDLLGPTLKTHWYQAETGYDLSHFSIDWETETVTCPQGQVNSSWTPIQWEGKALIQVRFSQTDCKACPSRASCTGTTRRTLTLHSQEQTQALLAARQRENTDAFKEAYLYWLLRISVLKQGRKQTSEQLYGHLLPGELAWKRA
jgi:Transposase DDE domain